MKNIILLLLFFPLLAKAQIVETIAGNGTEGYTGDGELASRAEVDQPTSIRFDHSGNMYIVDWMNNVVRKINTAGIITTVAGNGYGAGLVTGGYRGDHGPATAAELDGPGDVAFDAAGNMYITDNSNAVIRKVSTASIITTFAGTNTFGYNGDGIQATAAELNYPTGIIVDTVGNIYFSDEANARVRKISTSGIITTIAGTGTPGYNGDGILATAAQLREPMYIAFGPSGNLFIPDWTDHRVRMINSSGIISTVAGNGMLSDTGDGLPATAASISGCQAVVFDDSGNYFISNNVSCSIRKVNTTGIISTVVGYDTCGYNGDGHPAAETEINYSVFSTAIDAGGNLYFADCKNNRVRRVNYNTTVVNEVNKTPQNITIYPNPAHDEVVIKASNKIESIEIFNLMGQFVYKQSYRNTSSAEIPISNFANGVYFVKVNEVYAGKFVKE